jgi:hypothetical protein
LKIETVVDATKTDQLNESPQYMPKDGYKYYIYLAKVQEEEEEGRYRRAMSLVAKAFRSVSVIGGGNG